MKSPLDLNPAEFRLELANWLVRYDIPASEQTLDRCQAHLSVLVKWNRAMNLVGDLSLESAVRRHYGESLFLSSLVPEGIVSIADIGSGAGFPGVGVAASRLGCSVCLVESRQKKAAFLSESTRGWGNCSVFAGLGRDLADSRELVCSRGVDISQVIEVALRWGAGLGLLLSREDALSVFADLAGKGFSGFVREIPWRTSASALVMTPQPGGSV